MFSALKRQAERQVIRGGDIHIIRARLDGPLAFFTGQVQGRQAFDRSRPGLKFGVRIDVHRQVYLAVPQEVLCCLWVDAGRGQQRSARMPQRVEVGVSPSPILIRYARPSEVRPEHTAGLVRNTECAGCWQLTCKERSQFACRIRSQGQDRFASILAVPARDCHRAGAEVKAADLQASDFVRSQAGLASQLVAQGPLVSLHAEMPPAGRCYLQKALNLGNVKRPPKPAFVLVADFDAS